ncbi:hypothetical protein F2Q68_00022754 [Brassica cretica]|uniref:Potassium transporter n=1 Tax=Brassica cretica TaxID=69181 RepID=A0A8S9G2E1_BRACR|nr:hypothetical protein F2Q68_00022754 [Brassica cretica]
MNQFPANFLLYLNQLNQCNSADVEVPVVCAILMLLFSLQHYGTHLGFLFAPIVLVWLLCISTIGVYNIFRWNPHVYKALSPYYIYKFLKKSRQRGWMSLGGILLCITGSEAMFADLGHFTQLSIQAKFITQSFCVVLLSFSETCMFLLSLWLQIAFTFAVYPSLILAYMGQAAYLSKHHFLESDYRIGFYVSVPEKIRWHVLAIAILAAVVGRQAIITGTFSIIKQCTSLGCFPKVKIVHTSSKMHGQIYIPEINWTLMLLCLAVTVGFRDTKHISNASGLAVITVMLVTTCLMSLVIVLCWRKSTLYALAFIFFFGTIESLYFSASLIKFREGPWVPLALSFIFLLLMYLWHYGTVMRYVFDVQNKVSVNWLLTLFGSSNLGIVRVRGIGVISTELVSGVPAIFCHFVTNLPAFHLVVVFLCVKSVPVPHVKPEERFLIGRVGPKEYRLYRCIARYGYRDVHKDDVEFEQDLVCSIAEFIRSDKAFDYELDPGNESERLTVVAASSSSLEGVQIYEDDCLDEREQWSLRVKKRVRFVLPERSRIDRSAEEELTELTEAREAGMAFIMGHSYVRAKAGSSVVKKMAINFGDVRVACGKISAKPPPVKIVSGLVTNVASMLWKWLWSLQTSTTTTATTKSGGKSNRRFGGYYRYASNDLPDVTSNRLILAQKHSLRASLHLILLRNNRISLLLSISFIFLLLMYLWHYGTVKRYEFDVQNKVSVNWLLTLFGSSNLGIVRVRGIGVISTELVSGVPAIFFHFVTNLPAFHQVVVFLCVKSVPVPRVKPEERFLVGRVGPKEYRLYLCIARYGYRDVHKDDVEFEQDLVCSIAEFIRSDKAFDYELDPGNESERLTVVAASSSSLEGVQIYEDDCFDKREQSSSLEPRVKKRVRFVLPESSRIDRHAEEELRELTEAREAGMAFIMGHSYVRAKAGSSVVKKVAINFGYDFLRRNSRGLCYGLSTPHASTLEVVSAKPPPVSKDCKWTCDKCSINAVEMVVVSSDIHNHNSHHQIR